MRWPTRWQGSRVTYRGRSKAISAIDRRSELLGLVAAYRRLKADLGLMDFSDQIELGARLASESQGWRARARPVPVVLLDEVPGHLGRPGRDAVRLFGGGRRSPRSATPTRRSTAGVVPSVSNILDFAGSFPAAEGGPVPTYP